MFFPVFLIILHPLPLAPAAISGPRQININTTISISQQFHVSVKVVNRYTRW